MKYELLRKAKTIILGLVVMISISACGSSKELSNYEKGIEALEQQNYEIALNDEGENLQLVYRGEGMAYLGLGEYDKSLESFKSALDMSNGLVKKIDYDINYYMAVAECKAGKLEDAVNRFMAAEEIITLRKTKRSETETNIRP